MSQKDTQLETKSAVPRLQFDVEIVALVGTLFQKDEDFDGLGTFPGLVACRGGEKVPQLEPAPELLSDEEHSDSYYDNFRSEAQYGLCV